LADLFELKLHITIFLLHSHVIYMNNIIRTKGHKQRESAMAQLSR